MDQPPRKPAPAKKPPTAAGPQQRTTVDAEPRPDPAPADLETTAAFDAPPADLGITGAFDADTPAQPVARPERLDQTGGVGLTSAGAAGKTFAGGTGHKGSLSELDLEPRDGEATVINDYAIETKLGQGGMGAVYKARQISLERPVAFKVLFQHLAAGKPDFVPRFYREAKVMAKLNHPNIVQCYGVGEHQGLHYLAMEYVDGGNVLDLLKRHGKFAIGDALHITLACLYALQHAHEQQLIHRDVKPDNLLLTKKGVIKLADLGLGKALNDDVSLTQTGTGAGTPLYMSPEQCANAKSVDGRTDIYAVGVMLYHFLTGHQPFVGETILELFQAKAHQKYDRPRKHNPDIPPRLELIIDKALAVKPEQRYQTCAEFAADLEGLELAHATLSFFAAPSGKALVPKGPASGRVPLPAGAPAKAGPASGKVKPGPTAAPNQWYVQVGKTPEGKLKVERLTTEQILARLGENKLPPTAQASKEPAKGYRALAAIPEFEGRARSRVNKQTADKKGKLKAAVENIEEAQKAYERKKWFRKLFSGLFGWLAVLAFLAAVAGGGYWAWLTFGQDLMKK